MIACSDLLVLSLVMIVMFASSVSALKHGYTNFNGVVQGLLPFLMLWYTIDHIFEELVIFRCDGGIEYDVADTCCKTSRHFCSCNHRWFEHCEGKGDLHFPGWHQGAVDWFRDYDVGVFTAHTQGTCCKTRAAVHLCTGAVYSSESSSANSSDKLNMPQPGGHLTTCSLSIEHVTRLFNFPTSSRGTDIAAWRAWKARESTLCDVVSR